MTTVHDFLDPNTGTPDPLKGMGVFLSAMSGTDPRLKVDKPSAQAWLDAVGEYDVDMIRKAFAAHYSHADLQRFTIRPSQARSWIVNALPPRPRCPEHPSYYAGPSCGGCRAERLELGLEKAIGKSTVPQLAGPTPMPADVRAIIQATRRKKNHDDNEV